MQQKAKQAGTMARELKIPELAEGATDARAAVLSIGVKAGDVVEAGDTLLELETDKVVLDIPAECAGRLEDIQVAVGDEVRSGQVFARLIGNETGSERARPAIPGDTEACRDRGEAGRATDRPNDGADPEVPATAAASPGSDEEGGNRNGRPARVPANPSARRLARELGVDIGLVAGSGSRGRITRGDVERHARNAEPTGPTVNRDAATTPQTRKLENFASSRRAPLSGIAAAMRRNMQQAWSAVPHAWLHASVDVTRLERWRQEHKRIDDNGRLTMTVLLAKAMAFAMRASPVINSQLDDQTDEILFRKEVDIGVAVDTEHGLLVPVLRSVESKGLARLARELGQLVDGARRRALTAGDLRGASITLSNLGGFGIDAIFPIVNHPQAAIVGAGATTIQPVFRQEKFVPRRILPVTLAFDHRIVNGADGARFLAEFKKLLEDPMLMLV